MNIVIKNENTNVMDALSVDVLKTLDGVFTKTDLEREFINLYYNKVIIDISAIKNYYDENTLFSFLNFFEPSKIILVLNNTEYCNNPSFLKQLVEKGIYNFSKNASGINFLVNNPNNYDNVKKYLEAGTLYNPMSNDNEKEVKLKKNRRQKIIGIQSLTPHAGATTLMYMMVKTLKNKYNVKGIEVGNNDSKYFSSEDLITSKDIPELKIKINTLSDKDIIIVDLNGADALDICDEIIYLIEPGMIRLNRFIKSGYDAKTLNKGKCVLSRSMVKDSELTTFEYETKLKIFANLTNFNDRDERVKCVDYLLYRLGYRI